MRTDPRTPARAFAGAEDFWRIRALLIETHATTLPGWNWDLRRWDGWWFHREEPFPEPSLAAQVGLWETRDGRLVGAVHPEGPGEAFLELHPGDRRLEQEMVAWAEEHLATASDAGARPCLRLWVLDEDAPRRELLERRGYAMQEAGGWTRRMKLPGPAAVAGAVEVHYPLRSTRADDGDCARMAAILNAAFRRTGHTAREYRAFIDRSPSFEHDLNLVAVADDGSFAAHAGFTYDSANRHAILEPVCTHPDHRRHGLARGLIVEGLRRLEVRGALTVAVETGDGAAANALYAASGFVAADHFHAWQKAL